MKAFMYIFSIILIVFGLCVFGSTFFPFFDGRSAVMYRIISAVVVLGSVVRVIRYEKRKKFMEA